MNGGAGVIQTLNPHPNPPRINHISAKSNSPSLTNTNEIRVCTNRTCRRQGSSDVLQVLSGIAPSNISVNSCGCLGRCGAGPNLVVLPSATFVNHCATAARAAEIMAIVCDFDSESSKKTLEALSVRKKAEVEMENGAFAKAESIGS
ncbi:uncharacterized protein [Rutidosis leptorrhynchoides]|uniref:uncharacterized protein n=1 Tax=Rutidosis leptorrhynchoides TaxID=125765 RepID=UPI003A994CB4